MKNKTPKKTLSISLFIFKTELFALAYLVLHLGLQRIAFHLYFFFLLLQFSGWKYIWLCVFVLFQKPFRFEIIK